MAGCSFSCEIYRYDTKKGIRYVLSSWRKDGSPRGFMIGRDEVHERIDKLLDSLDASAGPQA